MALLQRMQRAARTTPEHRAEVIAYAVEHGASEAAKLYGHKPETIRSWLSRAGQSNVADPRTRAATEARRQQWEERRSLLVHRIGEVAEQALNVCEQSLAKGETRKASDASAVVARLVDKAQLLSGGHTARFGSDTERASVLSEAHGKGLTLVSDAA